jgi:DNA-binding CsgD family transcriptional regulator
VARLALSTGTLLRLAAGLTGPFDFALAQALTELSEEPLLCSLDEAIAAGLLQVVGTRPPVYDFAHAIVRHALYDEMNPDRRTRLHRRIALALDEAYPHRLPQHVAELAAQYHASAGLPGAERGIAYACAAAEAARERSSPSQAVVFLRMAADLAVEAAPAERSDVLCRLSIAQAEARSDGVEGTVEAALAALAAGRSESESAVRLLESVARALKESGSDPGRWEPFVDRALLLLGDRRDRLWAHLALLRDHFETVSSGIVSGACWRGSDPEAVAILHDVADEDDAASALNSLDWRPMEETLAILDRTRTWTRPRAIIRALEVVVRDLLYRHGDPRLAATVVRELLGLAERCGSIPAQAEALAQLAVTQAAMGDLVSARNTARQAHERIVRLGAVHRLHFVEIGLASVLAGFLDVEWSEVAERATTFAAGTGAARSPLGLLSAAFAARNCCYAARGDDARRLLQALTPALERVEPTAYCHGSAVCLAGEAVWRLGAEEYADLYHRLATEVDSAGVFDMVAGSLQLTLGRMAALLGDLDAARVAFARARGEAVRRGLRPAQAIIDYDEAVTLCRLQPGSASEITTLVDGCYRTFTVLAMLGWAQRAEALRLRKEDTCDNGPSVKVDYPDQLTPREVDVLRLIASGRTRKEIATELVITVGTVDRHISNLYGKVGARGRADAARYALRHGLIADSK